jgi:hypothetical protein
LHPEKRSKKTLKQMANRFIFSKTKLKNQSCKDQSWDNKLTKYKSAAAAPPISSERKQKASRNLARKKGRTQPRPLLKKQIY